MKLAKLIITMLFVTVFFSCKKEKQEINYLVKSVTVGSKISTFIYDEQKRLTNINFSNGKHYHFAYFGTDSVVRKDYDGANYSGRILFYLNSKLQCGTAQKSGANSEQLIHEFNSSNEMYYISLSSSSAQILDSIVHKNGNATSIVQTLNAATTTRKIITIEYNSQPNTLNKSSFGLKFLPSFYYSTLNTNSLAYICNANNKNLPIKEGSNITYSYEFDGSSRIIKRTKTDATSINEPYYIEQFSYFN